MPRLPQDIASTDPDIHYEIIDEFDELLEIDEIDDEPASLAAHEFGTWLEERATD